MEKAAKIKKVHQKYSIDFDIHCCIPVMFVLESDTSGTRFLTLTNFPEKNHEEKNGNMM